jgi:soluble lytic murein transglycosylase-like protein
MKPVVFLSLLTVSAWAGEFAVTTGGARLHVDRHKDARAKVVLDNGSGSTEMDAALIAGFEPEEQPAAMPPAAPAIPQAQDKPADIPRLVADAARKYNLPEPFLRGVIKAESAFRADARSPKGAFGLMQLMPATAKAYGADPADPAQNIDAGARYLAELLIKYDQCAWHALAAYNAGPGAVDRYRGVPPYRETRDYINRIFKSWKPDPTPQAAGN